MKILRVAYRKKVIWGVLKNDTLAVLKEPPFSGIRYSGTRLPLARVKILTPSFPTKVVLVGLNYRDHARELAMRIPKEPVIFLKPPSALIAHREAIVYPKGVARLDYEAELALVIKKKARNIREKDASKYILGYTCLNDVTARDIQKRDGQWTRAKSFDTFCPVGPWIETECAYADTRVSAYRNGTVVQDSRTSNFIFSVPRIVSFVSRVMTLMPGDVVSTGTPPGVGPLRTGDTISVCIDGVGTLENRVVNPR